MSDKITYKIEDIIIEISMGPFGSDIKTDCFTDSGVPLLDGSNITRFKLVEDKFKFVSVEKSNQLKKANAKRGDVVVTHRGTLGQISYIPDDSKYDKYLISQSQFRVCFKDDIVNPAYLVYYFHTKEGQKKLLSFASYVGVPALAQATSNFRLLEVSLPALSEQERIISFLDVIEQKIDLNTKINYELESLAKTIYDYWFLQFEFPDANGKPYKSSGGRMVWNEALKREVPEGWDIKHLSDCLSKIIDHRGITPKKLGGNWVDNGIIALSAKIVKGGKLRNLSEANQVSPEMYKKWMPEKLLNGDILMTSEAPLGEFYFILLETEYCLSQRLFAMRANSHIVYPTYLYYELSHGNGNSQIMGKQSGSTVFGIRQDELRSVNVLVPEIEIQKKFNNLIIPLFKSIRISEIENRELASLRDFLLPLLMNGQITFKDEKECPA